MEKGLLKNTGKSLSHWIEEVNTANVKKHSDIINFLKKEYGFTHGFANFVALKTRAADAASYNEEDLIRQQYAKGKEHLKPIYDMLISKINTFGNDVEIVPKKANVSIRRKRQFLLIQPSTKKRMDLGIKLNQKEISGRLMGSGSFGAMCSHKIEIHDINEIDKEVLSIIKQAYQDASQLK